MICAYTAALVAARQDRVLGMWCRKPFASAASIALAVGVTTNAIYNIVRRARAEGDVRAVVRPIREARRDRALDRWCREPFEGAPAIAESLGMGLGALHTLVRRARAAGDPRAVSRSNRHRRGGTWAELFLRLRSQGLDTNEIARISHRPVGAVRSTLAVYDRRAA